MYFQSCADLYEKHYSWLELSWVLQETNSGILLNIVFKKKPNNIPGPKNEV